MKRSVFISHSSEDKIVAGDVCTFLERNGVQCWIAPRDVTPGKNYGAAILDAIDECQVFVLILSSHSNKSNQVVREVERAASKDSVILPFRVEDVQPSRNIAFYVSAAHWLDASKKPVANHFPELLAAIQDWQKNEGPSGRLRPAADTAPLPLPPASRFPVFPLVIAAVVIALLIWLGLFYWISHQAPTRSLTSQPSASPENASPTPNSSPTPEPSSTAPSPTPSPLETTAPENAGPSGPSAEESTGRRKPGETFRTPAREESPAASATSTPLRLRPGQHIGPATPGENAASNPSSATTAPAPVVQEIAASSYLGHDYRPSLAFDGNPATGWVPKGRALEQSLIVHFKSQTLIRSVSILNGDGRDENHYRLNNRVHTLRLILSDGSTQMLTFEDVLKMQRFELAHPATVNWIKFEIVTVYRGSNNNHVGISEITFNEAAP